METILQQFFNLGVMEQAFPLILGGLKQTVIICLIVVPLGLVGGLAFALISLSRLRAVRWAAIAAIDFFRSVPPLVLLIFVYAGLPFAGFRLSPLAAVAISFFLNTSSYYTRNLSRRYRECRSWAMGCCAFDRTAGLSDSSLCRAAAGGAKRPARSRIECRRGGETHLDCERSGATGAALFC
jgi:His/Glu/Gln/Arg/opine family amino acid ABC transporter permease subunit